jgi:carbohydrate kinase (thermoresistant glucokinase family)
MATVDDEPPAARPLVVLMGPAGCGKTTIGAQLAAALAVPFVDGDDLHAAADRERMRAGQPLDDARRAPWLDRIRAVLQAAAAQRTGLVVACSALKRVYRDRLSAQGAPLRFVELVADTATLRARLASRRDHFFAERLLEDQLATLEPLAERQRVDATRSPSEVVETIRRLLDTG